MGPAADDEVAGGPFMADASFARQPASLHCSNFPAAASYIAGTADPTSSLPPFLPSSTAASDWASNYYSASSTLPQQDPHPWQQQLQHAAQATSSGFLANNGLQTAGNDDDFFATLLAHYSQSPSAQEPFAHLAVPQPQVQMQFAAQAYPSHQAMAAPVEAVPLAVVPASVAADGSALPDTPTGGEGATPGPRRRGRPRKNAVASSPNRPAPRRKASAVSNSAATSRQVQQPAAQAINAVVAVATSDQAGPCINPTELPDQEQRPLQSTSNSTRRRGRPRKTTGASSPNRPARRKKASVANSAAESGQLQQPAAGAVAVAAPIQTAPCANATALPDQEQSQIQSTRMNPCAWEEEASMVEDAMGSYANTTAPGVRFQPNNEEIIAFLRMKYLGRKMPVDFIKDFNVYQAHPETVQATCGESVNGCWYVFSARKRRYPNGSRPARSVGKEVGFWKSNTKETDIRVDGAVIGKVTTLTFEVGHQPDGIQTPWKMKEYCIPEKQHKIDGSNMMLDDWVLCKMFCNSHDDQDQQMVLCEEEGDQLDDAGEATGETEGDADLQIVPNEHTLSNSEEEELCVEDYLVCDPPFEDQDHDADYDLFSNQIVYT